MEENKTKKFYQQWWFYLIIVVVLFSGFFATDNESQNPVDNTGKNEVIEETTQTEREKNKYYVVDAFINKYNEMNDNDISDVIEIDIQDKEYYKVEFRLSTYKGAVAKYGKIGNATIMIINHAIENKYVSEPKSLRIYVDFENESELKNLLETLSKTIDENISQEEFNDVYETLEVVPSENFYPECDSFDAYITKKEIMIDVKNKSNFLK